MSNEHYNTLKESFLKHNVTFQECEEPEHGQTIGNLDKVNLVDNEIWIMQCPKGMNIKELTSQTLKMPGRTNFENMETICMDVDEDTRQEAFAYYNHGKFSVSLLPISGNIIVRDRIKANKAVTIEEVEKLSSTTRRVPMPKLLRTRHPLFGNNFKNTELNDDVKKRLKDADENSLKLLKETIANKTSVQRKKRKTEASHQIDLTALEVINVEDDEDVEFVSETIKKKRKKGSRSKEKLKTPNCKNSSSQSSKELTTSEKNDNTLQWLENIC